MSDRTSYLHYKVLTNKYKFMFTLSESQNQWLLLVGRVLLGVIFVFAGFGKLMASLDAGIAPLANTIAQVTSLPFPTFLAVLTIAVELFAGLALIIGIWTRQSALALIGFTLMATVFFHPGWSDGNQIQAMMKNLAIIGGLFTLLTTGAGSLSLDSVLKKRQSIVSEAATT